MAYTCLQATKPDPGQTSIGSVLPAPSAKATADVTIVGAGPAGLFLAAELGKRGLKVNIIGVGRARACTGIRVAREYMRTLGVLLYIHPVKRSILRVADALLGICMSHCVCACRPGGVHTIRAKEDGGSQACRCRLCLALNPAHDTHVLGKKPTAHVHVCSIVVSALFFPSCRP